MFTLLWTRQFSAKVVGYATTKLYQGTYMYSDSECTGDHWGITNGIQKLSIG